MKILIAEDEAVSRRILERAVTRSGHSCLVAGDGHEAWDLYCHHPVDVVISDWVMPGIDGPELCRRVRERSTSRYTYFMLLTSLTDRQHFLTGMQAGADDYLTKPLDRDELQVRLLAAKRVTGLHEQLAEKHAELERLNRKLHAEARRDPLTQMGNRLRLREDLDLAVEQVDQLGRSFCVALCDIDHFKRYNDRYGHLAGDEALREVAWTLSRYTRRCDGIYRYGGEEFLILFPDGPLSTASLMMERVRLQVEAQAITHSDNPPAGVVTLSGGLARVSPDDRKSVDELLRQADAALYHAKRVGRNRMVVYEPVSPEQGHRGAAA